jgi:hypothetical protein
MEDQSATRNTPGRRAAAYWFADGFPEIVLGVTLILCALAGILWSLYGPLPHARQLVAFLLVTAGFLLYYFTERPILEFLKSRVTYPRTGYVQPPEEMEPSSRSSLTTLCLSEAPKPKLNENVTFFRWKLVTMLWWFFYVFLFPGSSHSRWMLAFMMPLLALLVFVVSRRLEHRYSWWSTLVLALLGVPFLWLRIPPPLQPLVALLLAGAWILAQGLSTLFGYLHAHPSPRPTEGLA